MSDFVLIIVIVFAASESDLEGERHNSKELQQPASHKFLLNHGLISMSWRPWERFRAPSLRDIANTRRRLSCASCSS